MLWFLYAQSATKVTSGRHQLCQKTRSQNQIHCLYHVRFWGKGSGSFYHSEQARHAKNDIDGLFVPVTCLKKKDAHTRKAEWCCSFINVHTFPWGLCSIIKSRLTIERENRPTSEKEVERCTRQYFKKEANTKNDDMQRQCCHLYSTRWGHQRQTTAVSTFVQ